MKDCFHLLMPSTPWRFTLITQGPLGLLRTWPELCTCRQTWGKHMRVRRVGASWCLLTRPSLVFQVFSQDAASSFHFNLCQALNSSPNTRFQSRDRGSAMVVHDWFDTSAYTFCSCSQTYLSITVPLGGCCCCPFRRLLHPTHGEDLHQ